MEYTTNKNLAKPTENETYDLATVNDNIDKIDTALKANDDAIASLTEKSKNVSEQINIEYKSDITVKSSKMVRIGNVVEFILDIEGNFSKGETVIGTLKDNLPSVSTTSGGRAKSSSDQISAMSAVILENGIIRVHCLDSTTDLLFSFMYITK